MSPSVVDPNPYGQSAVQSPAAISRTRRPPSKTSTSPAPSTVIAVGVSPGAGWPSSRTPSSDSLLAGTPSMRLLPPPAIVYIVPSTVDGRPYAQSESQFAAAIIRTRPLPESSTRTSPALSALAARGHLSSRPVGGPLSPENASVPLPATVYMSLAVVEGSANGHSLAQS